MKTLTINKSNVRYLDIEHLEEYFKMGTWTFDENVKYFDVFEDTYEHFTAHPGVSEDPLLAYLSHQISGTYILDIGTRFGASALALSANPKNTVISYDIIHWPSQTKMIKDNILYRIGDFTKDPTIDYSKIDIINIDVDPHDGKQEPLMFDHLKRVGFSGIIVLDDISPDWPAMYKWWNTIEYEKYDLTDIGHWSGTGLVNFGNPTSWEIKILENDVLDFRTPVWGE